jgi:DNA-binding CsgD family transcriptional regulator
MVSAVEGKGKKPKSRQTSNSDFTSRGMAATVTPPPPPTATPKTVAGETVTREDNKSEETGVQAESAEPLTSRQRKKRRSTKVALNDTLRRIRYLIILGKTNLEIQDILHLNERTFYRHMAKIHKIDNTLFLEQEQKSVASEIYVFRSRLLKSYEWFMKIADNEKMAPHIRMGAQRTGLEVAWSLVMLKCEGPTLVKRAEVPDNLSQMFSFLKLMKEKTKKPGSMSLVGQNDAEEKGVSCQYNPLPQLEEERLHTVSDDSDDL